MDFSKLKPGLYTEKINLIYTWEELVNKHLILLRDNKIEAINPYINNGFLMLDKNINEIDESGFKFAPFPFVYIPKQIEKINYDSFNDMQQLKNIEVDKDNPFFSSEDGILYNKNKTKLIKYPQAKKETTFTFCENITEIEYYSFSACENLEEIIIPSHISNIKDCAFENCKNLKKVILQEGIQIIGANAFSCCEKLTDIRLPNSLKKIGSLAFYGSWNLENIVFGSQLETVGTWAFSVNDKYKIRYKGSSDNFTKIDGITNFMKQNNLTLEQIEFKKTLEDLINEGKSIREANEIIRKQREER